MDLSTPENAILTLENFYTNKDLEGVLLCRNFEKEAENMLIDSHHEVTNELKLELAEVLKLFLIQDLHTNGFPHFTGIDRHFSILSEKNDGEKLIEEILLFSGGKIVVNKFWTFKEDDGQWKLLNLVK